MGVEGSREWGRRTAHLPQRVYQLICRDVAPVHGAKGARVRRAMMEDVKGRHTGWVRLWLYGGGRELPVCE